MKVFSLAPREHKHRDKRQQHDHDGEKNRSAHGAAGGQHQLADITGDFAGAEVLLERMRGVLGHYNCLVDENADRNRDPGQ